MFNTTRSKSFFHRYSLYFITILASFVLSSIARAHYQPFNVDGILYLQTANAFMKHGIIAALSVYSWPFYSILVAVISSLTSFSLENAAFLLNFVLTTTIAISFIALVKEFGGNRQTLIFAAIVILLCPYLNHDRDNILRDFGYYAFSLISLLFFIRYLKKSTWQAAIKWFLLTTIAFMFRIEAIFFLVFAPLAVFLQLESSIKQRCINFIKLYCLPLLCLLTLTLYLLLKPKHPVANDPHHLHLAGINYLYYLITQIKSLFYYNFTVKVASLDQAVFQTTLIDSDSMEIFYSMGLLGILLYYIANTTSIFYLIIALYTAQQRLIPVTKNCVLGWTIYSALLFFIITSFLVLQAFLTSRYVALLGLLIILLVPFGLSTLYTDWRENKPGFTGKKWVFPIVCIFLLINLISGISHFGTSKSYLREAGEWINTHTPNNSRVFCNDPQLAYYSHRIDMTDYQTVFVNQDPLLVVQKLDLHHYDYIALVINHRQFLEYIPIVKQFKNDVDVVITTKNNKGDRTWILRVKNP